MKVISMVKNTLVLMFCAVSVFASEVKIPRSGAEDVKGIMSESYWAQWNGDVNARIDRDIEMNRKADFSLKIGKIAAGTKVKVIQISHEFYFGAHIFNFDQLGDKTLNARYKSLYGTIFNSATVGFYWYEFELQDGRMRTAGEYWDSQDFWANVENPTAQKHWRRPSTDPIVGYLKERGVRIHGHTLVWGNRMQIPLWLYAKCLEGDEREKFSKLIDRPMNYGGNATSVNFTPLFANMSAAELDALLPNFGKNLKREFARRITRIAEYYGDKIESWDVVNESLDCFADGRMNAGGVLSKSGRYGIMPADYAYEGFQVAQKAFPPNVRLNINDNPYQPFRLEQYDAQVRELVSRGCKIDVVGWQMHLFNPQVVQLIADGKSTDNPVFKTDIMKINPEHMFKAFDMVERANRPIHMSEITICAPDNSERGQMIQGVITRNLYRMWFSRKSVEGITWWNVVDGCGYAGEPSVSGLFTREMKPKPAYYALSELIEKEWKTNLLLEPNVNGEITFRGFKGKYRISWQNENGGEEFAYITVK